MSDASGRNAATTGDEPSARPRALVHKQILGAAREYPDASVSDLAEEVTGASPDLVERVLDEYGDPATESEPTNDAVPDTGSPSDVDPGPGPTSDAETGSDGSVASESGTGAGAGADERDGGVPDPSGLEEKQLAVLRAIRERPAATQKELAASLGVSRATVSKRVNRIEGFDWQARASFVDRLFADRSHAHGGGETPTGEDSPPADREFRSTVRRLRERVTALEARVEDRAAPADERGRSPSPLLDDPELVHKVVHACLRAETISEDEELAVLRAVFAEG